MRIIYFFLLALISFSCQQSQLQKQPDYNLVYQTADSILVIEKLQQFKEESKTESSVLLGKIARSFINTPYTSHTLEGNEDESVVVNLHEFDCTTFVETCLALTHNVKTEKFDFNHYHNTLKTIRYRNGAIDDYTSRLHYFTEWITNNAQKGFVTDITESIGGKSYPNQVNFMSSHPNSYPKLKNDSVTIKQISNIEEKISSQNYFYIPQNDLHKSISQLEEGLIIAFTTGINGLDVVHTGVTVQHEKEIHLLHASSDAGKVVISDKPLMDYIKGNRLQTGIMVLHPQ